MAYHLTHYSVQSTCLTLITANIIITVFKINQVTVCQDTPKNTIAVAAAEARLVIDVLISCNLFHLIDALAAFMTNWSSAGTLSHVSTHTHVAM